MKAYRSVVKDYATDSFIEKKSEFISYVKRIDSEEDAKNFVAEIKSKHSDATHNCYAYVVRGTEIARFSDDGEPSGTAGAPMLNILQKNEFANVLIIVTRYFGGILLGTGGLVRAYSDSLLKAIENSKKILKCLGQQYEIRIDYSEFENFKYYCKKNNIYIEKLEYGEDIVCIISMQNSIKEDFKKDYERKNIIIKNLKELSIKYVTKSI